MRLKTINVLLRAFGLVLVVSTGHGEPTRLWIERHSQYQRRVEKTP